MFHLLQDFFASVSNNTAFNLIVLRLDIQLPLQMVKEQGF